MEVFVSFLEWQAYLNIDEVSKYFHMFSQFVITLTLPWDGAPPCKGVRGSAPSQIGIAGWVVVAGAPAELIRWAQMGRWPVIL